MVFRATLSNKVNFNPLESFPYLTLIHPREQSLSKQPYDLVKRTFYRKKSTRKFRVILGTLTLKSQQENSGSYLGP